MASKLTVEFEFLDHGYGYAITPSDVPMSVVVEVLLGFLENLKGQLDAARVGNPDDARAWQMLGRLG